MKIQNNKISAITIALLLITSMFATFAVLPNAIAHTPVWTYKSYPYVIAAPNPVGVGQTTYVSMWVDNVLPGMPVIQNDIRRHNYTLSIIAPDGHITTAHWDVIQDTTGIQFYAFTPDQVGSYTLKFDYGRQVYEWNNINIGDIFEAASVSTTVLVQEQPLPAPIDSYPLPTEYWTRPIEAENTYWFSISSNWLSGPYISNNIMNRVQQYGISPNSPHIMWTKPVDVGGVVGGNYSDIQGEGYYMGRSYNARFNNPIVMNGVLYYELPLQNDGTGGGFMAVDLQTGQELWYSDKMGVIGSGQSRPAFGYLNDAESANQHGVIPQGLLFTTNFAAGYDPRNGRWLYNITNVPSGTELVDEKGAILRLNWDNNRRQLVEWNSSKMWSYDYGGGGAGGSGFTGVGQSPSTGTINATYNPYFVTTSNSTYDWNITISGLPSGTWNIQYAALDNIMLMTQGTYLGFRNSRGLELGVNMTAVSLKPQSRGTVLWTQNYPAPLGNSSRVYNGWDPEAGIFVMYDVYTLERFGYSLTNGNLIWASKPDSINAFGYFDSILPGYVAYGNLYYSGYDGVMHCWDIKTGEVLWTYGNGGVPGNSTFDVQQSWGLRPLEIQVISEGKIYCSGDEHSPNTPLYKDNLVRCINATTGAEIWTMKGWICGSGGGGTASNSFVADGYLGYINIYDMKIYVVGKGPSAMTIEAPKQAITLGGSLVISGTVTDIAAGTQQQEQAARFPNGVPAVSDASQGDWMEYVYMQKPKPTSTVGVPVTISVVDVNGNYREIGTTTTNDGFFSFNWKPDITGQYTVYASFAGSESYWSSNSVTSFAVDPAAPTPVPTEVSPQSAADMYFVPAIAGLFVLVIAVAIVLALLMLRKRP